MKYQIKQSVRLFLGFLLGISLLSCTSEDPIGGSGQDPDPVLTDFPIAYIKRNIPVELDDDDNASPAVEIIKSPIRFNPGAALFIRDRASPSAAEKDITTSVFVDPDDPDTIPLYDVRDLSVSPDGLKLVFSMRAPEIEDADEDDQPRWNIWTYDRENDLLSQVISSEITAEEGHDVMPVFLADGRIIFSSTRQRTSKAILLDEGKPQFEGQDEDRDGPAFLLHIMNDDGTDIRQISFNHSHDYYPTVLSSGRVAFLRWDNMGGTDATALYSINPDGSDLQILYGHHSQDTGISGDEVFWTSPTEMPNGELLVLTKGERNIKFGGDAVAVDIANYIEVDQMVGGGAGVGQRSLSSKAIYTDGQTTSPGGTFNKVFPLWDGSERMLVSWAPCLLNQIDPETQLTTLVACTDENLANSALLEAPPVYGLWMWNITSNTQTPIVIAEPGIWYTEPVSMQSRTIPDVIPDGVPGVDLDADLVTENAAIIHIRSVYDFDGVDVSPNGLPTMTDPTLTSFDERPAHFLRVVKGVAMPSDDVYDFDNAAFGRSGQQLMREIIGYARVEPDGSVKMKVPANIPVAFSVLDEFGRRVTARHQNWVQFAAGEERECKGCHTRQSEVAHGRYEAELESINAGATTDGLPFPNTDAALFANAGETMAEVYTRINGVPEPNLNVEFDDVWTDENVMPKFPSFAYRYQDLETEAPISNACASSWQANCRITIHFEDHIQPIFEVPRIVFDTDGVTVLEDNTCTTCHNAVDDMGAAKVPDAQLELTSNSSTDEPLHMRSYRELFFNDLEQEVLNGVLVDRQVPILAANGDFIYQTLDANGLTLFFTDDDGMFIFEPDGMGNPEFLSDTDNSLIFETDINGVELQDANGQPIPIAIPVPIPAQRTTTVPVNSVMRTASAVSSDGFFSLFRAGGTHAGRLSDAELRIITEWVDIGAQYFNNPFLAPED